MERISIAVVELVGEDGEVTPLYVFKDGKYYKIDKVLGKERHAPDVACVSPYRYDCIIEGKRKFIFKDAHPSNKWFSVTKR